MQNISTINKNKHNLISVYTTFSAIFLLSRDEKISAKNKQKKKKIIKNLVGHLWKWIYAWGYCILFGLPNQNKNSCKMAF